MLALDSQGEVGIMGLKKTFFQEKGQRKSMEKWKKISNRKKLGIDNGIKKWENKIVTSNLKEKKGDL